MIHVHAEVVRNTRNAVVDEISDCIGFYLFLEIFFAIFSVRREHNQ
jgi:hypothetical protein